MKLALFSHNPLVSELGAPKVLLELAAAMCELGARCDVFGPRDLGFDTTPCLAERARFIDRLGQKVRSMSKGYEVVEYDHEFLPLPRTNFSSSMLMVARSVLLVHYLRDIRIPGPRSLRGIVSAIVRGRRRRRDIRQRIDWADATIAAADLVNVSNPQDAAHLAALGVPASKLLVQPFGLTDARRAALSTASGAGADRNPATVAFVGTFDYRKGAGDFRSIVAGVLSKRPDARFRLLGTAGLFQTEDSVRSFFTGKQQPHIEIVPRFAADELPQLLSGCCAGLFPSYVEGFGFGVLEMLAAGLPVIAYDAPGPPMMLPAKWLVPPGETAAMSAKLVDLLSGDYRELAAEAQRYASKFRWDVIARDTLQSYETALRRLRGGAV